MKDYNQNLGSRLGYVTLGKSKASQNLDIEDQKLEQK